MEAHPFGFPVRPYEVQVGLMQAVHEMLCDTQKRVGLFESPTGTVRLRVR